MITPLTPTRAALAAALCKVRDESEHWQAESPCRYCGDLADRLLASSAVTDAGKLAEEVARIRQWLWKASQGDHTRIREAGIMQEACAQLDAALSAQSERAEVER